MVIRRHSCVITLIGVSYYVSTVASVRQPFRCATTAIFYCCSVDDISSVQWKDNKVICNGWIMLK